MSAKGLFPSNTPRRLSPWKEMLASPWGTAYWESSKGNKSAVASSSQEPKTTPRCLQGSGDCSINFQYPITSLKWPNKKTTFRFSDVHIDWKGPSFGKSICSSSKASSDFTRCSLTVCLYSGTGTISNYLAPLNITGPCPVEEITS